MQNVYPDFYKKMSLKQKKKRKKKRAEFDLVFLLTSTFLFLKYTIPRKKCIIFFNRENKLRNVERSVPRPAPYVWFV